MIQHKAHWVSGQKVVQPLSPRVHFLRVPCHLRFSLPGGRFLRVNWPRASTEFLKWGGVKIVLHFGPRNVEMMYRYKLYLSTLWGVDTTL